MNEKRDPVYIYIYSVHPNLTDHTYDDDWSSQRKGRTTELLYTSIDPINILKGERESEREREGMFVFACISSRAVFFLLLARVWLSLEYKCGDKEKSSWVFDDVRVMYPFLSSVSFCPHTTSTLSL